MAGFKFKKASGHKQPAQIEAGIYAAAIVQAADIGLQRAFDRDAPPEPQLAVAFEHNGGAIIAKRMKFSEHPASHCFALFNAAFPDLADESEFELVDLLGRSVLIDVDVNDGGWPRVTCISPLEMGFDAVTPCSDQIVFSAEAMDKAVYMKLDRSIRSWVSQRIRVPGSATDARGEEL
jgi:hypothetical protein